MDLKQHLLKRKRHFDEDIQQYKGPDPLKIRCEFLSWLEDYAKEDTADIYFPLLEETLKLFVEDKKYKQDERYVRLWLNYSITQPDPSEVMNNMHKRCLGTECGLLYSSWAKLLAKNGALSNADSVFRMGLSQKLNIQSKNDLQKQYDDFLKDILQNLLSGKIQCPKCGSPFQRSGVTENAASTETVQEWEWNPLKVGEVDDFQCPYAYFEEPDPTKIRMYPKDKVYPGNGQEFSLEELLALEYSLKYKKEEEERALIKAKEEENRKIMAEQEELRKREAEKLKIPPVQATIPVITPKMLNLPKDMDSSLANSTTFTVHTKEAMNVVQDMWSSPAPSHAPPRHFLSEENPPETNQPLLKASNPTQFEIYTEDEQPQPQKTPFQIYDENINAIHRKPTRSSSKPRLLEVNDNENAPPGQEIFISSKQASALKPKAPIEVYNDTIPAKMSEEKFRVEDHPESKTRIQLFRDDDPAELAEKFESQARIHQPMFKVPDKMDDFSDITCNTKAFDFILTSSTPMASQKTLKPLTSYQQYEDHPKVQEPTNLSVILEQSKDKSGNSSASSLASHTRAARSGPIIQSDMKISNEDIPEGSVQPRATFYRASSIYPITFLNTISEEDSLLLSDSTSPSNSSFQKVELNISSKQKYFNKTYSVEVLEESLRCSFPENTIRKSVIKNIEPIQNSLNSTTDKENLRPGMLGFPSDPLFERPNSSIPRRSSRNQPLTSIADKENVSHSDNLPQLVVKPYVSDLPEEEPKVKTNSLEQLKKISPKKLSLSRIPLSGSRLIATNGLTEIMSFNQGTQGKENSNNSIHSSVTSIGHKVSHTTQRINNFQSETSFEETCLIKKNKELKTKNLKFGKLSLKELPKVKSVEHIEPIRRRGKSLRISESCESSNFKNYNERKNEKLISDRRTCSKNRSDKSSKSISSDLFLQPTKRRVKIENNIELDTSTRHERKDENVKLYAVCLDDVSKAVSDKCCKDSKTCKKRRRPEKNLGHENTLKCGTLPERKDEYINFSKIPADNISEVNSGLSSKSIIADQPLLLTKERESKSKQLKKRTSVIDKKTVEHSGHVRRSSRFMVSNRCSEIIPSPVKKISSTGKKLLKKKTIRRKQSKLYDQCSVPDHFDPFSSDVIEDLLEKVGFPKAHHMNNYYVKQANLPTGQKTMKLADETYTLHGEIGKGAYAKVLKATNPSGNVVALKIEKPPCKWEFYIAREIQNRVSPKFAAAFMDISAAHIYNNGSILETPHAQYGTLITCIHTFKEKAGKSLDPGVILHFSIELIDIVENLHKCKIIHADLKPDNVVLRKLPCHNEPAPCLQLIDFGRCIDMSLLPPNTEFNSVFKVEDNKCIEMKENKSWSYQLDLQGLASIFHILLLSEYMKVQKKNDKWQLQKLIPRNVKRELWNPIFHSLLNVNPATDLPFNFSQMREALTEGFNSTLNSYLQQIKIFENIISGK